MDSPEFEASRLEKLMATFNFKDEFNIIRAAREGNIRQTFMEEIFGTPAMDNCITDKTADLKYIFNKGYLIDVQSINGLQGYALEARGSHIFNLIQARAQSKHTDEVSIIDEINFQFDCFANMPLEHLKLAYNDTYDYNIALVWFSLYGVKNKAKLSDFTLCVPDAKPMSISNDSVIMGWRSNIFIFKNDTLVSVK